MYVVNGFTAPIYWSSIACCQIWSCSADCESVEFFFRPMSFHCLKNALVPILLPNYIYVSTSITFSATPSLMYCSQCNFVIRMAQLLTNVSLEFFQRETVRDTGDRPQFVPTSFWLLTSEFRVLTPSGQFDLILPEVLHSIAVVMQNRPSFFLLKIVSLSESSAYWVWILKYTLSLNFFNSVNISLKQIKSNEIQTKPIVGVYYVPWIMSYGRLKFSLEIPTSYVKLADTD